MAPRTVASMRLRANVLLTTNISRKRNQRSSSASKFAPARNAHPRRRHAGRGAAAVATGGITSRRLDSTHARPPALRSRRPAAQALPAMPNCEIRIVSAPSTPASAPRVFQPYKRPSTRPKSALGARQPGHQQCSVAPMAVVGTAIAANAIENLIRLSGSAITMPRWWR